MYVDRVTVPQEGRVAVLEVGLDAVLDVVLKDGRVAVLDVVPVAGRVAVLEVGRFGGRAEGGVDKYWI